MVTMASGNTTGTVQCPQCNEPVTYPVHVRHLGKAKIGVSIDPAPIREHLATHKASFTRELPPTAR
jgi:hypothetical protein